MKQLHSAFKMPLQMDAVVKTYKSLAQIPALLGARYGLNGSVVNSLWSQRNLDLGKTTKFVVTYLIKGKISSSTGSIRSPMDVSQELLSRISPSENYKAIMRGVERKDEREQFLEIWSDQNLSHSVDLSALELHGEVYTDAEFGTLEWSPDETKVLYIAEKKLPKAEPFYKRKKAKNESTSTETPPPKGEEYLFRQSWGEQLVGKKESVIVLFDLQTEDFKILEGIPENVCPGQVVFAPDGKSVVGVALTTEPRKLGLIYCTNRPSFIFHLDFSGKFVQISETEKSVKSPKFTPDGKTLVWLQRNDKGPHHTAMTLVKKSFPFLNTGNPEIVVNVVKREIEITNNDKFYGLYNVTFPQRCWASERRLLLSTNQRNSIKSYAVDIDSGKITELKYEDGSLIILDVYNDLVLCNFRNILSSDKIISAELPAKGNEKAIVFRDVTKPILLPNYDNLMYSYLELEQDEDSDEVKSFTAIYVGPKAQINRNVPLIIWPHGGPHSAFANYMFLESAVFISLGYAVLLINYRGSIGNGEDSVNFLLGKIGQSDVSDCILATKKAISEFTWLDPEKLALLGGSHGGFLVTHLSGQYPNMFKAVVARNPVIDVASLSVLSDIPDWSFVECGFGYTQKGPTNEEELLAMRKASPIVHAHKVKAPTLLQVGSKDLRVPPAQALEYYHRLKANGVTVKMNLYNDDHPLGQTPHEIDNIINSILWIDQYVNESQAGKSSEIHYT